MEKFYVAAAKTVESAEELELLWTMFGIQNAPIIKANILEKAMDCQFFDVPTEPVARYEVLKATFLSFNWRISDDITKLKEIVDRLAGEKE